MSAATRPAYLRPVSIGLVLVGGAVGVAIREGLLWIENADGIAIMVVVVNLLGAFFLGCLYEALTRTDPGPTRTAQLTALLGTGFCGGLTTYSSLATDTAVLLDDSRVGVALAYALGTVLVGALCTVAGIAAGARFHPRRHDVAVADR